MSGNTPLRFLGVGNLLDREYRNSPAYQWGRELYRNGVEANATQIQFGPEWQGVQASGVYRMQYADNGDGMPRDQLREYMLTVGRGSKAVGGAHDNYAIGSRLALLPWNPSGVVVISMVDGEAAMVKMRFDPTADEGEGEYVLQEEAWEEDGVEGLSLVYPPYWDEDLGIDWAETIPQFIRDAGHGTTFILLGHGTSDDTLMGDRDRRESIRYLTRRYFNARLWDIPDGVTLRCVEFINSGDRNAWPKSAADRGAYQWRSVKGARSVVEYVKGGEPTIEAMGTVELRDGTKAHWFLRKDMTVDTGGVGSSSGFVSILYRDELYGHSYANADDGDTRIGAAVYRQFGIGAEVVRKRVFIVLEPPTYREATGSAGVAPSTTRSDLFWMGVGLSPRPVKAADWAEEFAYDMPKELQDVVNAAFESSRETKEDREESLRRIADRFSKRWRRTRARITPSGAAGDTTTTPTGAGTDPRSRPEGSSNPAPRPRRQPKRRIVRGRSGQITLGQAGTGDTPARKTTVMTGLPEWDWVGPDDIGESGMLAAWQKPNAAKQNGCVLIDQTHEVIAGQIDYWQSQYPSSMAEQVKAQVLNAYGQVAVAKVSHIFALTGSTISEEQRDQMLDTAALTAALVGYISEDALISPRLGGLGAKRKKGEVETDEGSVDPADEPAA